MVIPMPLIGLCNSVSVDSGQTQGSVSPSGHCLGHSLTYLSNKIIKFKIKEKISTKSRTLLYQTSSFIGKFFNKNSICCISSKKSYYLSKNPFILSLAVLLSTISRNYSLELYDKYLHIVGFVKNRVWISLLLLIISMRAVFYLKK